jgi:hypothetical protein
MQNRSILLFFTEFIFIFFILLIGCSARQPYFPRSYEHRTSYYVSKETAELIIPGQSNREDLSRYLGEPDEVYQEGRRFIYNWGKTKPGLVITLDETGTVIRKKYVEDGIYPIFYVQEYLVSNENMLVLRTLGGRKLNVGSFTATEPEKSEIICGLTRIVRTPFDDPFSEYIREALIAELKNADLFSGNSPVTLTGNLDLVDFNAFIGKWEFKITMGSLPGRSTSITFTHRFKESISPIKCALTAQSFMPAVQRLINILFQSPEFRELISE